MTRLLQRLRDAIAWLRRRIASRVRRLADRIDAPAMAPIEAPKSQGVVS